MVAVLGGVGWITPSAQAQSAPAADTPAVQAAGMEVVPPGHPLETVLFYAVAGMAVVSAVGVCVARNIVRMATWLFLSLGAVSLIYFLLGANFLGAIQLIVYAGGTLILLIFGVMLTSKSPWVRFDASKSEVLAAGLVCAALLIVLGTVLERVPWSPPETPVPAAGVADLGRALVSTYVVPFEMAGVLLMIVMVGAAHLARQEPKGKPRG